MLKSKYLARFGVYGSLALLIALMWLWIPGVFEWSTLLRYLEIFIIYGGFFGPLFVLLLLWSVIAVPKTRRKARRAGYQRVRDYLQAAPRSEWEKKDAVTMLMRGVVICLLGLVFTPFFLFGLLPLYYGGRKIFMILLGLDLLAEADGIA